MGGARWWTLETLIEQTVLARGAQGWGSVSTSEGLALPPRVRVDHPLEREGGIINNNANQREKTKPAGPEHFLNKEISLISWLI